MQQYVDWCFVEGCGEMIFGGLYGLLCLCGFVFVVYLGVLVVELQVDCEQGDCEYCVIQYLYYVVLFGQDQIEIVVDGDNQCFVYLQVWWLDGMEGYDVVIVVDG